MSSFPEQAYIHKRQDGESNHSHVEPGRIDQRNTIERLIHVYQEIVTEREHNDGIADAMNTANPCDASISSSAAANIGQKPL